VSGVSIDGGGGASLDVQQVLNGGQAFLDRLQAFQDAKAAHDAAFAKLGLGQNAAAEMDRAARMVEQAKAEAEQIRAQELEKSVSKQRQLNEFIAQATDETKRAMESAQAKERELEALRIAAVEDRRATARALDEANAKLEAARGAHAAVQAAQVALAKAL
jgi:hypothetical protein